MSKNSLEVLFGSKTRLKILKFLFRNMDRQYSLGEIANHTQEDMNDVRSELARLLEIKVIRRDSKKANIKKNEETDKE